jgi:ABC-2 type transport system permease protein
VDLPFFSHFDELFRYRSLAFELIRKDLRLKYKRSVLGILWSLFNPLLLMLVYTLVFSTIARFPLKHYPMFLLSGLLAWNFVTNVLSQSVTAIVNNANLVKKVYFPREVLVVGVVGANLVNFLISLLLLVPFIIVFQIHLGAALVVLPLLIILEVAFVLGVAFAVAALDVFFRDIEHLIQVFLLVLFFGTPIIYPYTTSLLSPKVKQFLLFNPLTWLMDSYQRVLYWNFWPRADFLVLFAITAIAALLIGAAIFARLKPTFAEEV